MSATHSVPSRAIKALLGFANWKSRLPEAGAGGTVQRLPLPMPNSRLPWGSNFCRRKLLSSEVRKLPSASTLIP
ncbi:hypothetical protein D3C86_1428660 [compost metagenome]